MLELISCSVTLPSSVVYRSDSIGPQRASFCSEGPLSTCWQRSVGLRDWYCGPWNTQKSLKVKEWHTHKTTCFMEDMHAKTRQEHLRSDKRCNEDPTVWWHMKTNCWSVAYRVIAGMFPAVTPLLSIVDLQQQAIWHVHILCCPFLSLQITQH